MADPTDPINIPLSADLLNKAENILYALHEQRIDLNDPTTFLAFQLLGPVLALATGANPRSNAEVILGIAESLDITKVRQLLKGI